MGNSSDMANHDSYPIAGNYQANVGRCMASAQNLRPMSPSRAGLRDRDARQAQIMERASPAYGVFDAEVKRPVEDVDSENLYFKEEMERYAAEIRRLIQQVTVRDQQLAAANEEIRKLRLNQEFTPSTVAIAPQQDVTALFHQRALQQAGQARGGQVAIRHRSTQENPANLNDPRGERLDELSVPGCEDPKPIRSEPGHHKCWGDNYNPTKRSVNPVHKGRWSASGARAGAPYRRFAAW